MQKSQSQLALRAVFVVLLAALPGAIKAAEVSAPGYFPLQFKAPDPHSYVLPSLGPARDGQVLDVEGNSKHLHELFEQRVILLSFIYTTCDDINGCPLATSVLNKVKTRLNEQANLAPHVRLLTLSFNPIQDTPEVMKEYGAYFSSGTVDWQFLTTANDTALRPILQHYGQSVAQLTDDKGLITGQFSHILRVFLIDRDKNIRNIYSTAFLHADTVLADIESLLAQRKSVPASLAQTQQQTGYGQANGEGKDSNALLNLATEKQAGLPPVPIPENNSLTLQRVDLGRKLFFDRRLSLNDTMSCAMCHIPDQGFTSNEMATAVGIEGRTVRRNSPSLYNVAYLSTLFHDGREDTLEQQVWGPLLAKNEMGNPSIGFLLRKINALSDYNGLFETAYGSKANMSSVGKALAAFQRTLISAGSDFDRWYFGKKADALSTMAQKGYEVFTGKGNCNSCHLIGSPKSGTALFTDNQLHNTGVGYQAAMGKQRRGKAMDRINNRTRTSIHLAPGEFVEVENRIISTVSEQRSNDLGLYEITQDPEDRWKYRTPNLRNVYLTAPYMHDGSLSTLEAVIDFYDQGGVANANLDPRIKPLRLNEAEKKALLAFLQSLTGKNAQSLSAVFSFNEIGDPR